jgi:PAS domain S-box-containing protein
MSTSTSEAAPGQPTQKRNATADGFHLASVGLTSLVALAAVTVLAGWSLGRPELKNVFPGSVPMKANTAIALLLTCAALAIYMRDRWSAWRDRAVWILAGAGALIAALTLVQHVTGIDLRIDQLLFADDTVGLLDAPGRMALSTAASLLFLNVALLIADSPGRFGIAQILTGGALFLSLLATVGYFFGVDVFSGLASYAGMALHTSGCLMLLGLALLFARPSDGVMAVVSDEGASGFVVRRLLPPVFVVPVLLAWLSRKGQLANYYTEEFSMTFFAVSAITALSVIVWAGGALLTRLEGRRLAAERLRQQSEERMRLAVSDAPVPMIIHDDEDHILHMSKGWSEHSGYTLADTPTITAWTTQAQGSTKFEVKAYVAKLAGARKTIYGGESTITAKTGESRIWDFSTTPLSQPGPDRQIFLTMAVDVTERKRAEAELRRMNEDLEQRIAERTQAITEANDVLRRQSDQLKEQAELLELVREGIIVRDLFGTIVYWSAGAVSMYGWPREEALGKVSHKLLKTMYAHPLPVIDKQVMATGYWEGESVHTTREGRKIYLESRWTVTKNERGVPQGILEVNRDITAKKIADSSLRDSESRFRAVAETAIEGIFTTDEQGIVRYWNPGAARMFERPEDQAVGQPLAALLPERLRPALEAGLAEYRKSHGGPLVGHTVEMVGVRKNGAEFPLEVSLSTFQTSKGVFFSGILRDITARKDAERALLEKHDELARSNQELEQFAYVASHDLQEPLRMVSNYTQLLGRRYKDQLDADAQEFIGFAVDGALRMQALIHDLLAYARVGTRGKEFKSTPADSIVKDAVVNLTGAIEETKAEVKVGPLPTIHCDGGQLTQVFQNLIGNALKFKRKDAVPEVRVTAARNGHGWTFAITDNGIGIDPKYFERIFQMFQRLHGRGDYPGTGIGLALCKKIVERHGGRVTVASEAGRGATFSFTIPDAGPQTS